MGPTAAARRVLPEQGRLGLADRHLGPKLADDMTLPRPLRTVLRVVATLALTFLGLLLVTFVIGRVVPIDPVLAAVGDRAPPDVYERVKVELGLHLPLWQQFLVYVGKVLQGDFGKSVLTANPVLEDIRRVFPATLELASWRPCSASRSACPWACSPRSIRAACPTM